MAKRNRSKPAPAAVTPAEVVAEVLASAVPAVAEVDEVTEQVNTTEPAEADKPTKQVGMSNLAQTIRSHRHRYVPALHPVSGKKTANNGDHVAQILLTVPLDDLAAFVATHFGKTYGHLNKGHNRMCCGNLVRAAAVKGDAGTLEWLEARAPKVEAEDEAA